MIVIVFIIVIYYAANLINSIIILNKNANQFNNNVVIKDNHIGTSTSYHLKYDNKNSKFLSVHNVNRLIVINVVIHINV